MQSPERSGLNIIATLNLDSPDQPILIGAQYDTVPGSPGADDNTSGVAAMLECSRILVEVGSSRKVVFAAFDAKELQSPAEGTDQPHTLPSCEMRIAHQQRSFSKLSVQLDKNQTESVQLVSIPFSPYLQGCQTSKLRSEFVTDLVQTFESTNLTITRTSGVESRNRSANTAARSSMVDTPRTESTQERSRPVLASWHSSGDD
tara:strand:- start:967 stop:1575 length:609 start_codon:yes stop_codon:yes gene_type:complete